MKKAGKTKKPKKKAKSPVYDGDKRQVGMLFCPKVYDIVKWWCKLSHQFIGTFVEEACINELVKQMDEYEAKLAKINKFKDNFFVDREKKAPKEAESEEEQEEEVEAPSNILALFENAKA